MYGGKIMETGTPDDIINNPGHPYTQALVSALPEFGTHYTQQKMRFIPGRVSDPANPPAGCPFSPRCAFSKNECKKNEYICWKQNEK